MSKKHINLYDYITSCENIVIDYSTFSSFENDWLYPTRAKEIYIRRSERLGVFLEIDNIYNIPFSENCNITFDTNGGFFNCKCEKPKFRFLKHETYIKNEKGEIGMYSVFVPKDEEEEELGDIRLYIYKKVIV